VLAGSQELHSPTTNGMTIDECGEPKYRQTGDMRRGSAIVELIQPVEGEIKVEPVT
jgi:hypothetical protein